MSGGRASSRSSTRIEQSAPELERIISASEPIQHAPKIVRPCREVVIDDEYAAHAGRARGVFEQTAEADHDRHRHFLEEIGR